jgi:riboflavin kinase/FMN adenylyltransferase
MGGEKISSGKIKRLLGDGEIQKANVLLGEEFFLQGKVVKDRQVGRKIGFPTANIPYPQDKYPLKIGVYETRTVVDGKEYKGITNYGARPTFDNDKVVTETYLDGFSGDLYGKELKVHFVRRLRDVQKFESVDALKKQLKYDVRCIREER